MGERALIVHGSSLLDRAYDTASPGRTGADGAPTHALYVMARALETAVGFKAPAFAVAVLDDAPRARDAPAAAQHEALAALLEGLGVSCVRAADAADVVAAYADAWLARGDDVVVVGSDKRLAQLVSENCWWYDAIKGARYTPDMVEKRFCVAPAQAAAWLALVGDDDTLPGVKGIGKKGATTLLQTYGSVDEGLAHVDDIKGRLGNALRAAPDEVRRQVERATLARGAAMPVPLEELSYRPPSDDERDALYAAHGFYEMLTHDGQSAGPAVACIEDAASLAAHITRWRTTTTALYAVTDDPSPPRGPLVGLLFATEDGAAAYVPAAGAAPLLHDEALVAYLEDAGAAKLGHNAKAAQVALARRGITLRGVVFDTEHASHLHEPSEMAPHDLERLCKRLLHQPLPEEDALRGVGRRRRALGDLPVRDVADFAAARARRLFALREKLAPGLAQDLLDEYAGLSDTLVRMELRGIACDADSLSRSGDDFERIGAGLAAEIYDLAGHEFLLSSTKQLGEVLFGELGLPVFRHTKTGWSTSNEALERIEHAHPIVPRVIRWRRLRRLTDTWVTALIAAIDDDGRVRSTFHPARSFSGRLVNSHPDLGRVPGRTPEMKRIRRAFAAPAGTVLMSVDYKQLGLYVLAHLTEDPALIEPLRAGADMHAITASLALQIPVEGMTRAQRQVGKVVNFATFASQGKSALAQQLGIEPAEAQAMIDRFFARYAKVRAFFDEQYHLAKTRGYIETIAGRRWPIGGLDNPDVHLRAYAERLSRRATHEASVADISRRALWHADLALQKAGLRTVPLLSILDEVLFEVPADEVEAAAEVAAEAMRHAFELVVPLRVGVKVGPNWADLKAWPAPR